jgi:hypothetical protein
MAEFEIGIIYQKGNRLFIASSPSTLLGYKRDSVVRVRPHSFYRPVRSASVEDICRNWKIDLDEFDCLMTEHMEQPQMVKTRPRGQRKKASDEEDYWRRHRTGRIARPRL